MSVSENTSSRLRERLITAAKALTGRVRSEVGAPEDDTGAHRQIAATDLPLRIDRPGVYRLSEDLHFARRDREGIRIGCSGVTLDLGGHCLRGPGAVGTGSAIFIEARASESCIVRNGSIREWGGCGVEIAHGSRFRLERVHAFDNGGDGFRVAGVGEFFACFANSNGGSGFAALAEARLEACSASRNRRHGFHVEGESVVIDCRSSANDQDGIRAGMGEGTITGCAAMRNGGHGIHVARARVVHACHLGHNRGDGILAGSDCLLTGNVCRANGLGLAGAGIRVLGRGNRVECNQLLENARGLVVEGPDNTIESNTAKGSPGTEARIAKGNHHGLEGAFLQE